MSANCSYTNTVKEFYSSEGRGGRCSMSSLGAVSPGIVSLHCWDLDLWCQNLISTFYEPKYMRDKYWVKFPSLVCEIWCSQGFWYALSQCERPVKVSSGSNVVTSRGHHNTYCCQAMPVSVTSFFSYWQIHRRTHRRTDLKQDSALLTRTVIISTIQ